MKARGFLRGGRRLRLFAAAGAAALTSWAGVASAAPFCFDLGAANVGIAGFTGPYAGTCVDLTGSNTATVTFTSDVVSGNIYLMGNGGSVDVNVNATTFSISGIILGTNAGTGFAPGPFTQGAGGAVDGFGSFNLTVNDFDGYTHSADMITFTLTDTSGTWASASDVLTANDLGFLAAAHIFVTSFPADASNVAIAVGFAAGTGPSSPVPEPATLALVGLGLAALVGGAGARRK